MMRHKKLLIGVAVSVAAVILFVAFGLPPIVRKVASDKLTEALHRKTAIREVTINPFTLEVTVRGLEVAEPEGGSFIAFDELRVDFDAFASLFRRALVAREVTLTGPRVAVVRTGPDAYNFSDLLPKEEPPPAPGENTEPTRFFVGNLRIAAGEVAFDNRPTKTSHRISDIDFFIPVVSNLDVYVEEFAQPHLSFVFDGSPVKLDGRTKPFADSLETVFDVVVQDLDLTRFASYSPVPLGFDLRSARLDLDFDLSYIQYREKAPTILLGGTAALRDIALHEKDGAPLLSARRLAVGIALSDVSLREMKVTEILCEAPVLLVRREKSGRLNLDALTGAGKDEGAGVPPPPPAKEPESPPFALTVERVKLTEGRVEFKDLAAWKPFSTVLSGVGAEAEGLDLSRNAIDRAELSFTTEAGETARVEVKGVYSPLGLDGSFEAAGIRLPKYRPYYGEPLNFEVERGTLGASGGFRLEGEEDFRLEGGAARLTDLRLKVPEEEKPFLELASLALQGVAADLPARTFAAGEVAVRGVSLRIARLPDGSLSTDSLVAPSAPSTPPERPWGWRVGKLDFEGGALAVEDRSLPEPAKIDLNAIAVRGSDLSNEPNRRGRAALSFAMGARGTVSLDGGVSVEPPAGEFRVAVKGVDLTPLGPYVSKDFRVSIAEAVLGVTGRASFARNAAGTFGGTFDGDAALGPVRVIGKENAEDLVRWGSVALNGLSLATDPMRVALESISVTDPYLRVDIAPDGTVNLAALRETEGAAPAEGETAAGEAAAQAPPEPAAPSAQPESPAPKVEVKAVALQGAVIDFSDRHIQPSYRMKFIDLAGRVTRMSSEETAGGAVTLLGSLDGYAPLEVTGSLNPFASEFFLDLKIDFRNIEMSPFTPYSSRYLGYKIEKGKLGLALAYHVLGKKLDSDNKLVMDQLTLGEAVESPDAVNLPVRFALALLTDRHGVIDLDVPVSGTLDDPEFSLGRVIWKVIVNILVKAVTSPFALLGSLFGGGEELSYAVFEPAGDVPPPAELGKLDKLVRALAERPALKLEIQGHADPEADALALRSAALEHKLRAAKVKETVKKGQTAAAVETVTVTPEERLRFLQSVMEAEKIPRPTKESRPLTAPEMEKLILAHIVITDDDLRQLASRRALAVREHIVGTGGIAPERVFLTEPKNLAPELREGVPLHRVEFALQ